MKTNTLDKRIAGIVLFVLLAAFLPISEAASLTRNMPDVSEAGTGVSRKEGEEEKGREERETGGRKRQGRIYDYFRLTRVPGKRNAQTLETSVVRFEGTSEHAGGKKVRVDLVAAVHLADPEYYEELNRRFATYDVVLYELVVPEGTEIDATLLSRENRDDRGNLLAALQQGMSQTLELEHQLDGIDYTPKNFVHADLTFEEFFDRINSRGDMSRTLSRAFIHSMSSGNQEKSAKVEGKLIATFFARNKSLALKRTFAEGMLDQMEESIWILGGDDGSAIISDRNAVAEKRLEEQFRQGKTNVAIFYGAAHLPEFDRAMRENFQLEKTQTQWIVAWDLTAKGDARKKCSDDGQE